MCFDKTFMQVEKIFPVICNFSDIPQLQKLITL